MIKFNDKSVKLYLGTIETLNGYWGDIQVYPEEVEEFTGLTFTATTAGTEIYMYKHGNAPVSDTAYSTDGVHWTNVVWDEAITLSNVGDKIYFRSNLNGVQTSTDYIQFRIIGEAEASGNVMSMIYATDYKDKTTIPYAQAFHEMFDQCDITTAPELPATELTVCCYDRMFANCRKLTVAPILPATTLTDLCYQAMFKGCTALTTPPALRATELAPHCYSNMFNGCSALTRVPDMLFGHLESMCFLGMFYGCTSIEISSAPTATAQIHWRLPVEGRVDNPTATVYNVVFAGCPGSRTRGDNLEFEADTGIAEFYVALPPVPCKFTGLCLTAVDAGSTVKLKKVGSPSISATAFSADGSSWTDVIWDANGESQAITLANAGDKVYVKNTITADQSTANYLQFIMTGKVAASGNIMSMYDAENYGSLSTIEKKYAFCALFHDCTALVEAPTLPATTLSEFCYYGMFDNTSIATAPALPAMNLAKACYSAMFQLCKSLTVAPILPADTLAESCYGSMFHECSALVNAPELPAETMTTACYSGMFEDCIAMTTAPALCGTTLADRCYMQMFKNCTSLIEPPALIAEELAVSCYSNMFERCTAMTRVADMIFTTLATGAFTEMYKGCSSLEINSWMSAETMTYWVLPMEGMVTSDLITYLNVFNGCPGTRDNGNDLVFNPTSRIAEFYVANTPVPCKFAGLCFTAKEAGSTIRLQRTGNPTDAIAYSRTGVGSSWIDVEWDGSGSSQVIILNNVGDKVYFKRDLNSTLDESNYVQFVMTGKVDASGNIMSMVSADNYKYLTTVPQYAFFDMFFGCTALESAPELPATNLADDCYKNMFYGCSALTTAPELPATTIAKECYRGMFMDCSALTAAPKLPARNMTVGCYSSMFKGCSALTAAPQLISTSLEDSCYQNMFQNCIGLTTPPSLRATELKTSCYAQMFAGCTALTRVPDMLFNHLSTQYFTGMFDGCTSIEISSAPTATAQIHWRLPVEGRVDNPTATVYENVFRGCPGTRIHGDTLKFEMDTGIAEFYVALQPVPCKNDELCFTAKTANATVRLNKYGTPSIQDTAYSLDGENWTEVDWTSGASSDTITLENIGDKVYWRNTLTGDNSVNDYLQFSTSGNIDASGNVMSMYDATNFKNATAITYAYAFYKLFRMVGIVTAPELPATTLSNNCYKQMFYGCSKLKNAPELPAMVLADNCYDSMFQSCIALKEAPALPATTLAQYCYNAMFSGCKLITDMPELPALGAADYCYYQMFNNCIGLVNVKPLVATTLSTRCYNGMFNGCTALTTPPAILAQEIAPYCYYQMFKGCTALTRVPDMLFTKNQSNALAQMFSGCTALEISSAQTATAQVKWRIPCEGLTTATTVVTYSGAFTGCPGERTDGDNIKITSAKKIAEFYVAQQPVPVPTHFEGLCLTAEEAGSTVKLKKRGSPSISGTAFSTDEENWTDVVWDSNNESQVITLANVGDKVYWKNNLTANGSASNCLQFVMTGKIAASGNIVSMYSVDYKGLLTITYKYAFAKMFEGCTALTAVPTLPATKISEGCYWYTFSGCEGITSAPVLPATNLAISCYQGMFEECSGLTAAPALPATSLYKRCYYNMFYKCTSITKPPVLPATTMKEECYGGMFNQCTSLDEAPVLGSMSLAKGCYRGMFSGCNSLVTPPELPATTLYDECYYEMFQVCAALKTAPVLPAMVMKFQCYHQMFYNDQSLEVAPALPATTLAVECYQGMFFQNWALTAPPELPATTLYTNCYDNMFAGCHFATPPALIATNAPSGCYSRMFASSWITSVPDMQFSTLNVDTFTEMFYKCYKLKISSTQTPDCQYVWRLPFEGSVTNPNSFTYDDVFKEVPGTRDHGDDLIFESDTGIAEFYVSNPPVPCKKVTFEGLCLTAEEAGSTVRLQKNGSPAISSTAYSRDGQNWTDVEWDATGSSQVILLDNAGDKVYWKNNVTGNNSLSNWLQFVMTGKVGASGNIMSMYDAETYSSVDAIAHDYAFYGMFLDCTALTSAPKLPAATLAADCYLGLFNGCTSLKEAPTLPADTLAAGCYNSMFQGCTTLAAAPALPAVTLAEDCYNSMFKGCTALVSTPVLPVTTLAKYCYSSMFDGCSALTNAPSLPAMTLAEGCYQYMFANCSALEVIPTLPATTLQKTCYFHMFENCIKITKPVPLPSTGALVTNCYSYMYAGCTALDTVASFQMTSVPSNVATSMYDGCSSLVVNYISQPSGSIEWRIPRTSTIIGSSQTQNNTFRGCAGTRQNNNLTIISSSGYNRYYVANPPIV